MTVNEVLTRWKTIEAPKDSMAHAFYIILDNYKRNPNYRVARQSYANSSEMSAMMPWTLLMLWRNIWVTQWKRLLSNTSLRTSYTNTILNLCASLVRMAFLLKN